VECCNLFVADSPDYRARQLTKYTKDDGQRLSNITWSSDGKKIVYVRGDSAIVRARIQIRPATQPAPNRRLSRISVDGGEPVKIGLGNAPELSPRGDQLVFLRRGQIFRAH
jgi:Tol biopolymer transport system component